MRGVNPLLGVHHYQKQIIALTNTVHKILIILGPFLPIEYFCLINEINTAPAGSSSQGNYEKGLQIYDFGQKSRGR